MPDGLPLYALALALRLGVGDPAAGVGLGAISAPLGVRVPGDRMAWLALDQRETRRLLGSRRRHLVLCAGPKGELLGALLTRAGRVACPVRGVSTDACFCLSFCGAPPACQGTCP